MARNLSWFLVAPVTASVLSILLVAALVLLYQGRHVERIYTGVMAWGLDLSGMQPRQAEEALHSAFPYPEQKRITFQDPGSGRAWTGSTSRRPPRSASVRSAAAKESPRTRSSSSRRNERGRNRTPDRIAWRQAVGGFGAGHGLGGAAHTQ